jgi:hypothetical protein
MGKKKASMKKIIREEERGERKRKRVCKGERSEEDRWRKTRKGRQVVRGKKGDDEAEMRGGRVEGEGGRV